MRDIHTYPVFLLSPCVDKRDIHTYPVFLLSPCVDKRDIHTYPVFLLFPCVDKRDIHTYPVFLLSPCVDKRDIHTYPVFLLSPCVDKRDIHTYPVFLLSPCVDVRVHWQQTERASPFRWCHRRCGWDSQTTSHSRDSPSLATAASTCRCLATGEAINSWCISGLHKLWYIGCDMPRRNQLLFVTTEKHNQGQKNKQSYDNW